MMTMPVASPTTYGFGLAHGDIRATAVAAAVVRLQTAFDGE